MPLNPYNPVRSKKEGRGGGIRQPKTTTTTTPVGQLGSGNKPMAKPTNTSVQQWLLSQVRAAGQKQQQFAAGAGTITKGLQAAFPQWKPRAGQVRADLMNQPGVITNRLAYATAANRPPATSSGLNPHLSELQGWAQNPYTPLGPSKYEAVKLLGGPQNMDYSQLGTGSYYSQQMMGWNPSAPSRTYKPYSPGWYNQSKPAWQKALDWLESQVTLMPTKPPAAPQATSQAPEYQGYAQEQPYYDYGGWGGGGGGGYYNNTPNVPPPWFYGLSRWNF
jgi:hypothetical protein